MLSNSASFIISSLRNNAEDWKHSHEWRKVIMNEKLGVEIWDYCELLTCKIKWKDDYIPFNFIDSFCMSFWGEFRSWRIQSALTSKYKIRTKKIDNDMRMEFDFHILQLQGKF